MDTQEHDTPTETLRDVSAAVVQLRLGVKKLSLSYGKEEENWQRKTLEWLLGLVLFFCALVMSDTESRQKENPNTGPQRDMLFMCSDAIKVVEAKQEDASPVTLDSALVERLATIREREHLLQWDVNDDTADHGLIAALTRIRDREGLPIWDAEDSVETDGKLIDALTAVRDREGLPIWDIDYGNVTKTFEGSS